MDRIILHVDVNNAFLSWTAVDMLKKGSKVDIRNRYAIIAGSESERKGIVLAKSNLCKSRGVMTAEPIYSARRKCPYLEIYSPNFKLYKCYSDKMFEYLSRYTNIIERYSIDECFLDYTGSVNLFGDPIKLAYKIKNELQKLGVSHQIIEDAISHIDPELIKSRINKIITKNLTINKKYHGEMLKNKIYANLINQGYDQSQVIDELNKYEF